MCRQLLQKNKNLQRKIEKNMLRKLVQAETHKTQLAFGIVPRASFSSAKPALAWDHPSGRRHVHQQINNTVGVAPLIVIPGDDLEEALLTWQIVLKSGLGVIDGRVCVVDEICGYELLICV
mmetsp:Transcript_43989/g.76604  ORF Transcript_43989/g.76604 Transcript_43989/m.76604 type:complete len:121 (-) Transcript_43989:24-386(-)